MAPPPPRSLNPFDDDSSDDAEGGGEEEDAATGAEAKIGSVLAEPSAATTAAAAATAARGGAGGSEEEASARAVPTSSAAEASAAAPAAPAAAVDIVPWRQQQQQQQPMPAGAAGRSRSASLASRSHHPHQPSAMVPWQFQWKRPELHPVVGGGGKDGGDLSDMIPVSSASARLTPAEARVVLRSLGGIDGIGGNGAGATTTAGGGAVGGVNKNGRKGTGSDSGATGGGKAGSGDRSSDRKLGGRNKKAEQSLRWEDLAKGGSANDDDGGNLDDARAAAMAARSADDDGGDSDRDDAEEEDCVLTVTVMAADSPPRSDSASAGRKGGASAASAEPASASAGDVVLLEVTAFANPENVDSSSFSPVGGANDGDDGSCNRGRGSETGGCGGTGEKDKTKADVVTGSGGRVRLITSKTLRWPSSALLETLDPVEEEDEDEREHPHGLGMDPVKEQGDEHDGGAADDDDNFGKAMPMPESGSVRVEWDDKDEEGIIKAGQQPHQHPDEHGSISHQSAGGSSLGTWDTFLSRLHLRGSTASEIRRERRKRARERRERSIRRRRVGVASVALCRRRDVGAGGKEDDEYENMSNALDALRMLTLGMGDVPHLEDALEAMADDGSGDRPSLSSSHAGGDAGTPVEGNEIGSELVLCFLSNDGRVHIYGALDVLGRGRERRKETTKQDRRGGHRAVPSSVRGGGRDDEHDDGMSNGLASLLFGRDLLTTVKSTMLPLSNPDATVVLSQFAGTTAASNRKGGDADKLPNSKIESDAAARHTGRLTEGKVERHAPEQKGQDGADATTEGDSGQQQQQLSSSTDREDEEARAAGRMSDSGSGSAAASGLLDLSYFDATIEPTTAQYRTVRNVPTMCVAAFDYVAIGGKGIRRMRRRKLRKRRKTRGGEGTPARKDEKTKGVSPSQEQEGIKSTLGNYASKDAEGKEDAGASGGLNKSNKSDDEINEEPSAWFVDPAETDTEEKEVPGKEVDEEPSAWFVEPDTEGTERVANLAHSNLDSEQGGQQAEVDSIAPGLNDRNAVAKPVKQSEAKSDRDQWEWEDYFIPGGFVSFISLRHFSETRTVFLPFSPKAMSPVVWDNKHFIIALAEDRESTDSSSFDVPLALAVRVDSCRPGSNDSTWAVSTPPPPDVQFVPKEVASSLRFGKDGVSPMSPLASETSLDSAATERHGVKTQHPNMIRQKCFVRRFMPLPILLPNDKGEGSVALSVTSMLTSPPAIAMCRTTAENQSVSDGERNALVELHTLSGFDIEDAGSKGAAIVLRTTVCPGHFAHLPLASNKATTGSGGAFSEFDIAQVPRHSNSPIWCLSGQGWSVVGTEDGATCKTHFISWEGATASFGAYTVPLSEPSGLSSSLHPLNKSVACHVLPTEVFLSMGRRYQRGRKEESGKKQTFKLPFTDSMGIPRRRKGSDLHKVSYTEFGKYSFQEDPAGEESDTSLDDIVVSALESIRDIGSFDADVIQLAPETTRSAAVSPHKAKSVMLLKQCSSWTQLDNNEENRALIDGQVILSTIRFGPNPQQYYSLTMRKNVIENGIATPFHQVLSWLCQGADYFTAASVALNLLHDIEAVRDLRGSPSAVEGEDERSYLEGLLDGIIPLDVGDTLSLSSSASQDRVQLSSTVTSLADMAVGCLIRGGSGMSRTLEGFLGRNIHYDESRACLMLAATTANAISELDEPGSVPSLGDAPRSSVVETVFERSSPTESVLWPIRCLLRLAVTRECMPTALRLLNATIPNEIRCRAKGEYIEEEKDDRPSRELCKSIVTMVVASSPSSAGYLLSLTDEDEETRYWQSLDHDTQLSLSLISIAGKFPLLREAEVRTWTLEQVSRSLEPTSTRYIRDEADASNSLPSGWLRELCTAALSNAGCHFEQSLSPSPSNVSDSDEADGDGVDRLRQERKFMEDWLTFSPGSGGIDFDVLIPALLLLQRRSIQWRDGTSVSTQRILNAVCDLAGRPSAEEPDFAFDATAVMKQCAVAENVPAAGNLIGGQDGFVLLCADILMKGLNLSMKKAENVLLKKGVISESINGSLRALGPSQVSSGQSNVPFTLTAGHRQLLLLLEDRVLSIKTYGEFGCEGLRGRVDPVFAARVCLRAWLCLMNNGYASSNAWLVTWLRTKLGMTPPEGAGSNVSRKRLACAALSRALLWPDDEDMADYNAGTGKRPKVLAEDLNFECKFLVELSQACCGLLEPIPPSILDDVLTGGSDSEENGFMSPTIQV